MPKSNSLKEFQKFWAEHSVITGYDELLEWYAELLKSKDKLITVFKNNNQIILMNLEIESKQRLIEKYNKLAQSLKKPLITSCFALSLFASCSEKQAKTEYRDSEKQAVFNLKLKEAHALLTEVNRSNNVELSDKLNAKKKLEQAENLNKTYKLGLSEMIEFERNELFKTLKYQ